MTTNLTTRPAHADTITAIPHRTVPRETQMGWFVRLIPLALMAVLSIPLVHARVTYTYTGNNFTDILGTLWTTSNRITATLTTPGLLPAGYSNSTTTCPAGTTYTLTAGTVTISTTDPNVTVYGCYFATDGSGNITTWYLAPSNKYFDILTETALPGANPATDEVQNSSPTSSEADIFNDPGTWTPPTASNITTALLGMFTGGIFQINKPNDTTLTAQLTTVLSDLTNGTNGQACTDLQIFANDVKAKKGNAIKSTDAATIMRWVGWIAAAIPGCQVH
jgi:hypothetical protein